MEEINLDQLMKRLSLISSQNEVVEMAVDLHDINESLNSFKNIINNIFEAQLDKEALLEKLLELEIELDHINWHYKSIKNNLKKVTNNLLD